MLVVQLVVAVLSAVVVVVVVADAVAVAVAEGDDDICWPFLVHRRAMDSNDSAEANGVRMDAVATGRRVLVRRGGSKASCWLAAPPQTNAAAGCCSA